MPKFILDRRERYIPSNPTLAFAQKLLQEAQGASEVISIGGGSTIDIGKYIAFNLEIPHTAIPTTAGTGSEVTKYAVFTVNGEKLSLEDDKLVPTDYIHDPSLVVTCPPLVTASSGLDALSQAIESDWNKPSKEAKKAITLIMDNLVNSYKYPLDEEYRQNMLTAAMLSGVAINKTKTSICHALSYYLTLKHDIPHGIACAVNLPQFMSLFGYKYITPEKVENTLRELNLSSESTLKGVDVPKWVEYSSKSGRFYNTPQTITKCQVINLLQ